MKNIILIGYMGCGKSTVGKMLANSMNYQFMDTDQYIVDAEGIPITEIFATKGETYFRKLETKSIEKLITEYSKVDQGVVFATGGGLPMREENQILLRQLGTVIFLEATKETIYQRVRYDEGRPLLQCDDPIQRIEDMLRQRTPAYRTCADVVVHVDEKSLQQIIEEIQEIV